MSYRTPTWLTEDEDEYGRQQADAFRQWAQQHPPTPPVGPSPPPEGESGPAAARAFGAAARQLQAFRDGLLGGLVERPEGAQALRERRQQGALSSEAIGRGVQTAARYVGERVAPGPTESWDVLTVPDHVPAWVVEKGPEAEAQWREMPRWQQIANQAGHNAGESFGAGMLERQQEERRRASQGEGSRYTPEEIRQQQEASLGQLGMLVGGFTAGPRPSSRVPKGKAKAVEVPSEPASTLAESSPEALDPVAQFRQEATQAARAAGIELEPTRAEAAPGPPAVPVRPLEAPEGPTVPPPPAKTAERLSGMPEGIVEASTVAKEPWQMTRDEFASEVDRLERVGGAAEKTPDRQMSPEEVALWEKDWKAYSRSRGYTDAEIADYDRFIHLAGKKFPAEYADWAELHREHITEALARGKPIPPEVLSDYPDLAAKYSKATEVRPTEVAEVTPPPAKEAAPTEIAPTPVEQQTATLAAEAVGEKAPVVTAPEVSPAEPAPVRAVTPQRAAMFKSVENMARTSTDERLPALLADWQKRDPEVAARIQAIMDERKGGPETPAIPTESPGGAAAAAVEVSRAAGRARLQAAMDERTVGGVVPKVIAEAESTAPVSAPTGETAAIAPGTKEPWQMTRVEFEATGESLQHGTSRPFIRFGEGTVVNRYGRPTDMDRFYFTSQDAVAQRFANTGGFRQVSPEHTAETMGLDAISDRAQVTTEVQSALDRAIARGKKVSYVDDTGTLVQAPKAADVPDAVLWDGDVRVYDADRWPRIIKTNVYGRTLDLTNPTAIPDDLKAVLERSNFRPWEEDLPNWNHEYNTQIIKYAADNGYGKIRVRDGYESGFVSTIALPDFIAYGRDPHLEFVKRAIAEGRAVPADVLADYPSLKLEPPISALTPDELSELQALQKQGANVKTPFTSAQSRRLTELETRRAAAENIFAVPSPAASPAAAVQPAASTTGVAKTAAPTAVAAPASVVGTAPPPPAGAGQPPTAAASTTGQPPTPPPPTNPKVGNIQPAPPPPGKYLSRLPTVQEAMDRIDHPGLLHDLGQRLATTPGVRRLAKPLLGGIDPNLVAVEQAEKIPLLDRQQRAVADNISSQVRAMHESIDTPSVTIVGPRFTKGVTPKDPWLAEWGPKSLAVADVYEHPYRYDTTPELAKKIDFHHQIVDELKAMQKEHGIVVRELPFEAGGHYAGRLVRSLQALANAPQVIAQKAQRRVEQVATRTGARPDMPRHYEYEELGLQTGVDYEGNMALVAEALTRATMRKVGSKQLHQAIEPLSKTPVQLVEQGIKDRLVDANKARVTTTRYVDTLKQIRDGMALYYTTTKTPKGQPSKVLRRQVSAMEALEPGTKTKIEAALGKSGTSRMQAFKTLVDDADALAKGASKTYGVARREYAEARRALQSPEPFVDGAPFGLPGVRIPLGHVRQGWASGRLFDRPVAEYLNQQFQQTRATPFWRALERGGDVLRTMGTAIDWSAAMIQGNPVMSYRPRTWAKATARMVWSSIGDPNYVGRLIRENDDIRQMVQDLTPRGLQLQGFEQTAAVETGGLVQRGAAALTKAATAAHPTVGKAARVVAEGPFERGQVAFSTFLNISKIYTARSLYSTFKKAGKLDDLVTWVENLHGTRSSKFAGIGDAQRAVEGTAIWYSPRATRSAFAIIGDAMQGGLKGGEARLALGAWIVSRLAGAAAIRYAWAGIEESQGQQVDWNKVLPQGFFDPTSDDFASFELLGRDVSFMGGPIRAVAMLITQSAYAARNNPEVFLDPKDRYNNPLTRYWSTRKAPITGVLMDAQAERDFMGEPLKEPQQRAAYAAKQLVPMWAREGISPATALDVFGMRATPKSPAEQRDALREQWAEEYIKTHPRKRHEGYTAWQELHQGERSDLEKEHSELAKATQTAQETGERRGYLESSFWSEVDRQRVKPTQQIQAIGEQLRRGEISGNEYREEISQRERDMARIPAQLKQEQQWKDVALTEVERKAKYKDTYRAKVHEVDRFLEAYYALSQLTLDPKTQRTDIERLMNLREKLKAGSPPEVVAEAMRIANRNRDPQYVEAQAAMRELSSVPRYAGATLEHSRELGKAANQYYAQRDALAKELGGASVPQGLVFSRLARTQGADTVRLAQEAQARAKYKNPEWLRLRQKYAPLLTRFYSDLVFADEPELAPVQPLRAAAGGG